MILPLPKPAVLKRGSLKEGPGQQLSVFSPALLGPSLEMAKNRDILDYHPALFWKISTWADSGRPAVQLAIGVSCPPMPWYPGHWYFCFSFSSVGWQRSSHFFVVTTNHSFGLPPSPLELSHSLVLPRFPLLPTGTNQAESMWQLQRGALWRQLHFYMDSAPLNPLIDTGNLPNKKLCWGQTDCQLISAVFYDINAGLSVISPKIRPVRKLKRPSSKTQACRMLKAMALSGSRAWLRCLFDLGFLSFCVRKSHPWPAELASPAAGVAYLFHIPMCLGNRAWLDVYSALFVGVSVRGLGSHAQPGVCQCMNVCSCVSVWSLQCLGVFHGVLDDVGVLLYDCKMSFACINV